MLSSREMSLNPNRVSRRTESCRYQKTVTVPTTKNGNRKIIKTVRDMFLSCLEVKLSISFVQIGIFLNFPTRIVPFPGIPVFISA